MKKFNPIFLNFHWETVHKKQVPNRDYLKRMFCSKIATYGKVFSSLAVKHWEPTDTMLQGHPQYLLSWKQDVLSFTWCKFCRCADGKRCWTVRLVVRFQMASMAKLPKYSEIAAPEDLPIETNVYRNLGIVSILEISIFVEKNYRHLVKTAHERIYVFYR